VISETNTQIFDALQSRPDCELVDIKPILSKISPTLKLNESRKTIQLWTNIHQTDCMFLAAIRKN
jgi:16S rRNA C967 or C1407 C5-methylase (RsmB/RsmF family)